MSEHESKPHWYVVQTKPLSEGIVEQHLKNAKFETFLPRIKVLMRGKKRTMTRTKTLFPSYLFIHMDIADVNAHRMIRYTRGVRKVLGDGSFPVSVPDEMIEIIRSKMDGEGIIEQRLTMKKGDAVRVRSGVFQDLIGILEKPVSVAGRVKVLLSIMRHQVKCELSAADVERLD